MAKSKRKSEEWSPQAPDQAGAPQAPDERARQGHDEQSSPSPEDTGAGLDHDLVARRAYDRYLARGGGDGQDLDDWLVAERETMAGEDETGGDRES